MHGLSTSSTRRQLLVEQLPALALGAGLLGSNLTWGQPAIPKSTASATGKIQRLLAGGFMDGKYALPTLPYAYDALEPHIDEQTMRLHHDRHHKAYVDNLNNAITALAEMRQNDDYDSARLESLQRDISFNAGGHVLHSVFWGVLGPSGGQPTGELQKALQQHFGGFEAFKSHFMKVATGIKGSGWAVLVYEPFGQQLLIVALGDQDLRHIPGAQPLLPLDVWEHAYYLKYQNQRAKYVEAFFNVIDWSAVQDHLATVRTLH